MVKLIGSLAVGAMLVVSCASTALLSSGSPTPSAGAATHDVAAKQATLTNEANAYTTSLADYLISHARMESESAAQQAAGEAGGIRAVIDDQAAGDFAKAYSDLHAAYQHAASLGDAM